MAEWAPRVFWKDVRIVDEADGHGIRLDGRPVRTPAKRPLVLPTLALAEAVADEWRAQEGTIDPQSMPVTRGANSALDKVAPQIDEVAAIVASYAETDLLCYRAAAPHALSERQRAAWDPWLDWAADEYGARLVPVAGVMPVAQEPDALARLAAEVARRDAFALTALSDLVALSGSLVLGLAVDTGRLDPARGWDLSRLDETFQQEQWGTDEEAAEAALLKREAFLHAERFGRMAR